MVMPSFPTLRMRRLRQHTLLRTLIRETELNVQDLIFPLFIHHGKNIRKPISSMPDLFQLSVDHLADEISTILELGIPGVMLFGIPEHKDAYGIDQEVITTAIKAIKTLTPNLLVMTDVCLCEYTEHGHCGIIHNTDKKIVDVDNDVSLIHLAKQALNFAQAGADVVVPSANMDGMVGAIRQMLDKNQFNHIPILSHAVKYASALYGPFREAAQGAPQFGDRKTYQIDPANSDEALQEVALDIAEGADMVMVKPASFYLDIIQRIHHQFPQTPLAAYHVSGEYAMIKAAAQNGWISERAVALETLTAIKRAGARFIITYYAKEVAAWLKGE